MPELKKALLSDLSGKDNYHNVFDIDLFREEGICFRFRRGNENFVIEAHATDSDTIDYTIYDGETLRHIDGGKIECRHCGITLGVFIAITDRNRFASVEKDNVELLDYDCFVDSEELEMKV